nr:hypothetical protein HUO10_000713 [Paraburkholderia busanensis]
MRPLCRAVALILAAGFTAQAPHAYAAGIVNLGQATARNTAGGAAGYGGAGTPNLGVSPQQALQASQPSIRNLGHAAQAIAAQIAAQQNAANAAAAVASNVPNGLAPGGLQVAPGVSSDIGNPLLWINANAPTQSVDANGHVNVNVQQTASNAVLTWQTMNVGRQTTLNFDQSGGTQTNGANNWAVFNRIVDPSGAPSQILGNINAQGAVYVINRNGILFGAGSQVNVHALVASSLNLLDMNNEPGLSAAGIVASNQQFLSMPAGTTGGLAYPESGTSTGLNGKLVPNEILGLGDVATATGPYQAPGDITIQPGASITTQINGTVSDGGFVIVAAPNVTNGGSITATAGQVVLAAGVGVSVRPNAGATLNPQILLPELSGKIVTQQNGSTVDITPAGTLINTGIVQASRGTVNLLGSNVAQNGVVGVTTSVNTPGAITISTVDEYQSNKPTGLSYTGGQPVTGGTGGGDVTHRAGLLSFGPDSVTAVLADNNGQTATSTPGTVFVPGSVSMTAGSVWFQGGSLIEAPGSGVSVTALTQSATGYTTPAGFAAVPGRIYLDDGATIDVSGLANVELPLSSILLTIDRIGQNELADSPLLRDGFLFGQKGVVVDSTLTGTRSDGLQWVGSPILNLSGYVNAMPRTVDQLLTNGGTITLSGNEVMTATGSSMNLNGGYVHYDSGMLNTTRLVDASGAIVPIGQASPYDTFVGIAGQFTESHPRWGVTKTWYNPLQTGGTWQPEFIVGGNAGTLDLYATQSLVLDGDISAQAFDGSKQMQGNDLPAGGTFNLGTDPNLRNPGAPISQTWNASDSTPSGETSLIVLQNAAPDLNDLTPGFSFTTSLNTDAQHALPATDPSNVLTTMVVPVDTLNNGGFANLNVASDKISGKGFVVGAGTRLALQPGGSVTLSGTFPGSTTVAGSIVVPSGTVTISNGGDITVLPTGQISVAGQWVNNDVQVAPGTTPGNSQFIDGGKISLSAGGRLDLQAGSVLDVSGGGEMQANGQLLMSNGIPAGKGGSVSLVTFDNYLAQLPSDPYLSMNGTIRSLGFSGGGTLTLGAAGFQIGGDAASAPAWDLVLPSDFFAQQGFGNYVLNAYYDSTVAPGTMVRLTQQNALPDVTALQKTASGASLSTNGLTSAGTLDAYHRQATGLVLTGGGYLPIEETLINQNIGKVAPVQIPVKDGSVGTVSVGQGASIVADAGANIGLGGAAQVTVLGSLIAPGGSITLSADSGPGGHEVTGQYSGQLAGTFTSNSKSVWLGPDAVLDVSGVALVNPLATPVKSGAATFVPVSGKVLPGGSVTLSDDSGYVVAQAGSRIDVSGTSANFDQVQANGTYASQPVWSDAGSITIAASSGLMFDGTLRAQPGASEARGGTLTLAPLTGAVQANQADGTSVALPGATALVLQQSGQFVPAGLSAGQDLVDVFGAPVTNAKQVTANQPTGVVQFAVDRLSGSGIATLVLGSSNTVANAPVAFAGNVDIDVAQAVQIYASRIVAISGDQLAQALHGVQNPAGVFSIPTLATLLNNEVGASTPTTIGSTVTLNAPYVSIAGPNVTDGSTMTVTSSASDATLNVNASFIDLVNQFQLNNFGNANFTSSGDIRLSSTIPNGSGLQSGELYSPGNLAFKAADLYPSTGSTFILDAAGPSPTTIAFQSNGAAGVPLSAGGTLLVDATDIVQGGTVRAPSGSLVFGVGDATNTATQTQFGNLPIVNTNSVTFANGSVTSVSNDNTVIPYGTTVDGVEWQFNPGAGTTLPDLNAPPSKFIGVSGGSVALSKGATIDLSGGGDLQAAEWVPGTGGTRNVLSQYNVSYANNSTGVAIPTNAGGSNVYAIVPGAQSPVSAYDPTFAQTLQPSTNANGTVGTRTATLGVGQAGMGSALGQSVYLSGVPGLAPGYYTLLPGMYATLPGAYRVTVASSNGNVTPGSSSVLADGTVVTAGYVGNAITGARSATPTLFNVQSGPVWQQYSQYTTTGANQFFPTLAAGKGNVTPPLPVDGGQLALAASHALALGATLNTAAGPGGAPAEVDIASQNIQITGNGTPALAGYLQISATDLDSLNAGSLLIGGTRTATTTGISINALADSVVVSNNAASVLSGPEILLVTKTDPSGTDPNAANGLRVDAGSAISASGSYPAAKDQPIAIAGDGSLLRVSNGAMTTVTRTGATGTGLLTVGANATLNGGQALTLDSSGNLKVDPSATLSAKAITVDGSAITFTNQGGAEAANLPGFVLDPAGLAQLANAQQVILRSAGAMNFIGNVDATFGSSIDLSAGTFTSDGGNVVLNGQQVAFTNEAGAPLASAVAGSGSLTVNAKEIDFGSGDKVVSGFGSVTMNAQNGIVGQHTGTFDFGALPVTLNAPVYLADTSSASTVKTTGALSLNGATGTALTRTAVGGALTFIGGTLTDNGATIAAPAGNVSLEATSGNLTIGSGSTVSAAGVSKQFFDITQYAPAGSITLTADAGTVDVQSGSTLDFSGAKGGGAAGSLTVSAPQQGVNLNGTLKGGAASGFAGGSVSLATGSALDLDALAQTLASSGVNNAISIQTKSGNLTLSAGNTLTAHQVALIADGGTGGQDPNNGNVQILGTIDASGVAGGQIGLYGRGGVDVEGTLRATGSSATQRGGTVTIGTTGTPGSVVTVNPTYGYENISAANSGVITLGNQAVIDVSGGTAGGLSGGTVGFRAPLLDDGTVNVTLQPGAQIKGARSVNLEAYAVWSTTDPSTGAQHFDGIVDPAGWYNNSVAGAGQPGMVAGTWTDQKGNALAAPTTPAQLADYLTSDYFTPTQANADHQGFYGYLNGDANAAVPGTLMSYVENGVSGVAAQFAGTGIANFHVVPGIELDNPSTAINNGDISVLTNWNLGAGTSQTNLAFRFNGQAPDITFRAENNVKVNASLTDGFFQVVNPVVSGGSIRVPSYDAYGLYTAAQTQYNAAGGSFPYTGTSGSGLAYYAALGFVKGPTNITGADPQELQEYYALYVAYAQFLDTTVPAVVLNANMASEASFSYLQTFYLARNRVVSFAPPAAPPAPTTQADFGDYAKQYLLYVNQYAAYVQSVASKVVANTSLQNGVPMIQPPAAVANITPINTTSIDLPTPVDNTPSPVAAINNPLPLASASLAGGSSVSWGLVAGANFNSADPLAVQAASVFRGMPNNGNVTMDTHTEYVDANGLTLVTPTTIRTGTGSISIAASNNVSLIDTSLTGTIATDPNALVIPGAIYTAGAPTAANPAVDNTLAIVSGVPGSPDIFVSPAVNPDSAGDITIRAQGNISGMENVIDTQGTVTGTKGSNISQFWWQWMEITANPTVVNNAIATLLTRTSIDFGAFDQGVMSAGGNVSVNAGGTISDLGVSLPTTWYLNGNGTPVTVGGGNLSVHAGGDILSGDYFVASGTGTMTAGGRIGSDINVTPTVAMSTILATQNGVLNVTATQGVDLGAVLDPSLSNSFAPPGGVGAITLTNYRQYQDSQNYSSGSSVNVLSATGDVTLGGLASVLTGANGMLPASLNVTAFDGGISVLSGGMLYPSANGQLNLIADQSIDLSNIASVLNHTTSPSQFGMLDSDPAQMPSPTQPGATPAPHAVGALHADDTTPARIYSLNGSIVDGKLETAAANRTYYDNLVTLSTDKPTLIQAGQDVVNLAFNGQNLRSSDVTRVVAGRDIYDASGLPRNAGAIPALVLGGPGTFDIEAGRNIGPLTNQAQLYAVNGASGVVVAGIDAVGNANNLNLPHESADINVLFGVGPGVDLATFVSTYVAPGSSVAGVSSVTPALIAFMEQYDAGLGVDTGLQTDKTAARNAVGTLSAALAWQQFQALPPYVQQLFAEQVLFGVLTQVGTDYNNPASPYYQKYARGYEAINTLFPASFGYTANNLAGGSNGANQTVSTGNLDIRSTTIQTQQGGNISILGPGGQALVGSTTAPPTIVDNTGNVVAGPGSMGILTLEQGNINIFTDQSVLLAQSRIFTEQGGDLTIWSSNGDINAGKGAKSSADAPAPQYVCDANHYCTVDARGEVSGAGIATLQSVAGSAPGNATLVAPRGTVDAGDAGIRVSGNLNVAALHVANADNIQVQGVSLGVPVSQSVNTGALSAASSAASAASQMAQDLVKNNASGVGQRRWTISVQVEGFGDTGDDDSRKRKRQQVGYDPSSAVSILGFGQAGPTQRSVLSTDERARLGKI